MDSCCLIDFGIFYHPFLILSYICVYVHSFIYVCIYMYIYIWVYLYMYNYFTFINESPIELIIIERLIVSLVLPQSYWEFTDIILLIVVSLSFAPLL